MTVPNPQLSATFRCGICGSEFGSFDELDEHDCPEVEENGGGSA